MQRWCLFSPMRMVLVAYVKNMEYVKSFSKQFGCFSMLSKDPTINAAEGQLLCPESSKFFKGPQSPQSL